MKYSAQFCELLTKVELETFTQIPSCVTSDVVDSVDVGAGGNVDKSQSTSYRQKGLRRKLDIFCEIFFTSLGKQVISIRSNHCPSSHT